MAEYLIEPDPFDFHSQHSPSAKPIGYTAQQSKTIRKAKRIRQVRLSLRTNLCVSKVIVAMRRIITPYRNDTPFRKWVTLISVLEPGREGDLAQITESLNHSRNVTLTLIPLIPTKCDSDPDSEMGVCPLFYHSMP